MCADAQCRAGNPRVSSGGPTVGGSGPLAGCSVFEIEFVVPNFFDRIRSVISACHSIPKNVGTKSFVY
jgi:hypothetical protein